MLGWMTRTFPSGLATIARLDKEQKAKEEKEAQTSTRKRKRGEQKEDLPPAALITSYFSSSSSVPPASSSSSGEGKRKEQKVKFRRPQQNMIASRAASSTSLRSSTTSPPSTSAMASPLSPPSLSYTIADAHFVVQQRNWASRLKVNQDLARPRDDPAPSLVTKAQALKHLPVKDAEWVQRFGSPVINQWGGSPLQRVPFMDVIDLLLTTYGHAASIVQRQQKRDTATAVKQRAAEAKVQQRVEAVERAMRAVDIEFRWRSVGWILQSSRVRCFFHDVRGWTAVPQCGELDCPHVGELNCHLHFELMDGTREQLRQEVSLHQVMAHLGVVCLSDCGYGGCFLEICPHCGGYHSD